MCSKNARRLSHFRTAAPGPSDVFLCVWVWASTRSLSALAHSSEHTQQSAFLPLLIAGGSYAAFSPPLSVSHSDAFSHARTQKTLLSAASSHSHRAIICIFIISLFRQIGRPMKSRSSGSRWRGRLGEIRARRAARGVAQVFGRKVVRRCLWITNLHK